MTTFREPPPISISRTNSKFVGTHSFRKFFLIFFYSKPTFYFVVAKKVIRAKTKTVQISL